MPPLYLITPLGVYKNFRNDDIQNFVLMIYNSFRIDDIQGFALIYLRGEADDRCRWQMKRGGLWRTECDRSQCEKKGALLSEEIQSLARRFIDEAREQYF